MAYEIDYVVGASPWTEYSPYSRRLERWDVLIGDNAADDNHYVILAVLLKKLNSTRYESHVRSRENTQAYNIDILL